MQSNLSVERNKLTRAQDRCLLRAFLIRPDKQASFEIKTGSTNVDESPKRFTLTSRASDILLMLKKKSLFGKTAMFSKVHTQRTPFLFFCTCSLCPFKRYVALVKSYYQRRTFSLNSTEIRKMYVLKNTKAIYHRLLTYMWPVVLLIMCYN